MMNTDNILDGLQKPTWIYGNQDDWDKLQKSRDAWRAVAERLVDEKIIVDWDNDTCRYCGKEWSSDGKYHAPDCPIALHEKLESEEK